MTPTKDSPANTQTTPKWEEKWEELRQEWRILTEKGLEEEYNKIVMDFIRSTRDEAVRKTRKEILAIFDQMVTLRPKEAERSDIITFRDWLRRRVK